MDVKARAKEWLDREVKHPENTTLELAQFLDRIRTEARAEADRLIEALTPSAETKGAYIGEFSFPIHDTDEDGEEVLRKITVPWTTVKEIMAAIRKRAAILADEVERKLKETEHGD